MEINQLRIVDHVSNGMFVTLYQRTESGTVQSYADEDQLFSKWISLMLRSTIWKRIILIQIKKIQL